jgi:dihydrofolate reductase
MRTVTFGVGNSLDNFIARIDHSVDWLNWDDEVAAVSSEFMKSVDTIVMGRKTYEAAVANGTTSYAGFRNVVFSRTIREAPDENVEIVSEDACDFVRELRKSDGKGICVMGGGELARSLFEADLIDELGLNIHPVLLGTGVPLFLPMSRQVNLELFESRTFKNGGVLVRYRVNR